MAAINEYPKFENNICPYLDSLYIKLSYATLYKPDKVPYYERLIKEWLLHTPKQLY
jgi:hypothetical protein